MITKTKIKRFFGILLILLIGLSLLGIIINNGVRFEGIDEKSIFEVNQGL